MAAGLLLVVSSAGCATADADAPTPVPTFATPSSVPGDPGAEGGVDGQDRALTDCAELLPVDDLNALLGLPLDSVAVRTTVGVAEPSVGRTARLACRYTGNPGSPVRGDTLMDLNAARYVDDAAATNQWRINADVESGERRDLPIGAASAAVFERPRETVLMVVYGASTVTFVLPDRPLPQDRPRADTLVDLALRVLPAIASPAPTPPPTTVTGPAVAAG